MANQWHYTCKGKEMGPIAPAELKRLAETGSLLPTDLVWKDGMADWVRAGSLKGLLPGSEAIRARVASSPTPAEPARESPRRRRADEPENDGTRPERSRFNRTGAEDEYDDEMQPRRLTRSPSHSSAGLWIGLAVAGGLLVVGIAVGVIVMVFGHSLPPNQPIMRQGNKAAPPANAVQPPIMPPPINPPPFKPPVIQPPKMTPKKIAPKNLATVIPGEMFPFLATAVLQNRLADVAVTGLKGGKNKFRDVYEDGGLLVGLQIGKDDNHEIDTVNAIRPIYMTLEGEKMGSWHGPAPAEPITLKAKEGYVVGGMNMATSTVIDGISLKFMQLADNRLLPGGTYLSAWVGKQAANRRPVGGQGYFIVGVCGNLNDQEVPISLGFVAVLDAK